MLLWLSIRTYGQFRILSISTVIVWKTRLPYETTCNSTYEIYFRHVYINICLIVRAEYTGITITARAATM